MLVSHLPGIQQDPKRHNTKKGNLSMLQLIKIIIIIIIINIVIIIKLLLREIRHQK